MKTTIFQEKRGLVFKSVCAILGIACMVVVLVFLCDGEDDNASEIELSDKIVQVTKGGTTNLVNSETGKTLIKDINVEWIQQGDDSLAVYAKDKKRGYFNVKTGEIVVPPTYKHAWLFSEGLAGVEKDDKIGFIDHTGKVVIDFQFPYRGNRLSAFMFHDGHCVVANSEQKIGVIDTLGNWVIQPLYDNVKLAEDYAIVSTLGDFNKQIDYKGHIIRDCLIENIYDIYYSTGYTNLETGEPEETRIANKEYFEYKVCGRSGLMNKYGEFITKPIYTNISGLSPVLFRATLQDNSSEILINTRGEVLSKLQ